MDTNTSKKISSTGIDIKVPALGESVSEVIVARWLKNTGDPIEADEIIAELETDKVTAEVTSPSSGVLGEICAPQGTHLKIGELLGRVIAGSAALAAAPAPQPSLSPLAASPTATPSIEIASSAKPLSPAVRRVASENALDLENVTGNGKDGRLIKEDALNLANTAHSTVSVSPIAPVPSSTPTSSSSSSTPVSSEREKRVSMSTLRRRIAERLKASQNTAAMLTTFNEIDMSRVMEVRKTYQESFEKKHNIKLGFMSFFTRAVTEALRDIPSVNAEIQGDEIVYKNYYHIGVAVGTEQGLVVPVLRDADALGLAEIEEQIGLLAKKARDGKLAMSDLTGGTFTITNGGVYGSMLSTPILNPPQSGILGLHKIQNRPIAIGDTVVIRPMMYVALTYDHRLIDGKEAVTFLVRVKEGMEDPMRLMLAL